jgi:DNA-directed RNA polymerase
MNQYQWEAEAYTEGMEAFFDSEAQDRLNGKADETAVGSSVLRQRVLEIAAALEEQAARKTRGMGGAYIQALRVAATRHDGEAFYQDYNIPAYIGLLTLMQASYAKNDKGKYLAKLAVEIGRRLEYDQQLYVFRKDNPAFVGKIETSLAQQGVSSLRHKVKTYQKKWRDADMKWEDWGEVKRLQVGIRVIKSILTVMDDCFVLTKKHDGRHPRHYIDTTLEFDDFVIEETDLLSKSMAIHRPLIEPPIRWERIDGEIVGGYHTPALRRQLPFIKTTGTKHREFVEAAYPHKHITAVNHMQGTAWRVNTRVHAFLKEAHRLNWQIGDIPRKDRIEVPPHPGDDAPEEEHMQWLLDAKRVHGRNKQNASELITMGQSLLMADRLEGKPFWFTYSCDFRGRVYCNSPRLSPQGPDHIKGLIEFNSGKPLGREGVRWLAINGANKYGYDKVDYNDRVRWVMDQRDAIRSFVGDPFSSRSRSFIAGADKPFQFAAFCYEWADAEYGTNAGFVSHLPIGLDGSCNGLQHYGALLRDPRGGAGVNLTQSELPADIYGEVASEFIRKLERNRGDGMADKLLALNLDRKIAKRPVMTLPYGSTQQSCREYIRDWLNDQLGNHRSSEVWPLATYATPLMWEAIADVVISARVGMDWLQQSLTKVTAAGQYAHWLSPADFPVYQHYSDYETVDVQTDLFGRLRIKLVGEPTGVQARRARNGIAPNFIHAMDASHMVMTILEARGRGIQDMAMIHDDFGVHAADVEEFFEVIRLTFVRMYYDRDWLMSWKKEMERLDDTIELDDPPPQGDLDLLEVIDSKYFFG